jgi:hypothetical protein
MARLISVWSHDLEEPTPNLAQLKIDSDELQTKITDLLLKTLHLFFLVVISKESILSNSL